MHIEAANSLETDSFIQALRDLLLVVDLSERFAATMEQILYVPRQNNNKQLMRWIMRRSGAGCTKRVPTEFSTNRVAATWVAYGRGRFAQLAKFSMLCCMSMALVWMTNPLELYYVKLKQS